MNGKSLQMLTRSAVIIAAVLGTQIATATQEKASAHAGRSSFSQMSQTHGNQDNRGSLNGWPSTWQGGRHGYQHVAITSAVPEPETYAMMLAGLGLMGAIVRRRKNANKK